MKITLASILVASVAVNAAAVADPEAHKKLGGGHIGWCGVPGQNCGKREIFEIIHARNAEAISNAEAIIARNAEAHRHKLGGGHVGWCGVPGQNCGQLDLQELGILTRDPEAHKKLGGGHIGWCGVPGQNCGKREILDIIEKRNAERLTNAEAIIARNTEAHRHKLGGGHFDWCGVPGQNCGKRDLQELDILRRDFEDDEE